MTARACTTLALILLAALGTGCNGKTQVVTVPIPSTDRPTPQFTVTGTAKLEVEPDCADLAMVITGQSSKSGQAAAQAQERQRDLLTRLAALGVSNQDIKLSGVRLSPQLEYSDSGRVISRKFGAEIRVTVVTRDFSKISELMDAGAAASVTNMTSNFRRENLDALKIQVRDLALAAAKAKGEQMAAGLGFTLGSVVNVNENPAGQLWSNAYFPNASASMTTVPSLGDISVETQALTVDVGVSFEIMPKTS